MSNSPSQNATGVSHTPGSSAEGFAKQPVTTGQQQHYIPLPAELDKSVAVYLEKNGYQTTKAIFLRELSGTFTLDFATPDIASDGKQAIQDEPEAYNISYKSLREWIENSLDWYKPELRSVLFPIFVHAYLDLVNKSLPEQARSFMAAYKDDHSDLHMQDLNRLETATNPQHVNENPLAQIYLNNKYNLRMSSVPFELFLKYLHDNKFMLLLRIVNQYLNIQVVHGKLLKSAGGLEMDDVIGITGHPSKQLEDFNRQRVQLGPAQMNPIFREEVENALKEKDQELRRNDHTDMNAYGEVPLSYLETFKRVKQEATLNGPAFGDIPLPPYFGNDILAEIDSLKDLGRRIPLGVGSLPSICCYTFHNTHNNLNCLTATKDASLIAGGFGDSFIKIWSLTGDKLRGFRNNINPVNVNDYTDLNRQRERQGSECKRLVGHSGAVYGLSFSHDKKYLASSSEDGTARLWSTDTFTNLAIFKGHDYPVWDVDFGPAGLYFATASHDRTARLWSCEHIQPLRIFLGHLSDVDTVRFHPNSKYIATGSSDRTARLWDIQQGTCVRVFTGHTASIKTVAFSPDGQLMASAGEDKSIILWDIASGKRLKKMVGHTGFIYSLSFSADGNVIVSGGADGTVRVWDAVKETTHAAATLITGDTTTSLSYDQSDTLHPHRDLSENSCRRTADVSESKEQLGVFPTKNTPVVNVQFTNRNLCIVAGPYCPLTPSSSSHKQ